MKTNKIQSLTAPIGNLNVSEMTELAESNSFIEVYHILKKASIRINKEQDSILVTFSKEVYK